MTIPPMPDSIPKIFFLLGVVTLVYTEIETQANFEEHTKHIDSYKILIDSLELRIMDFEHNEVRLVEKSTILSKKFGLENPINQNDSSLTFHQVFRGNELEVSLTDTLMPDWIAYKEGKFYISKNSKNLKSKEKELDASREEFKTVNSNLNWIGYGGLFLLVVGLIGLLRHQEYQDELFRRQLIEKPRYFRYCQSCGRTYSTRVQRSKNSDGTTNTGYCNFCYDHGRFTEPNLTKEEMKTRFDSNVKKLYGRIGVFIAKSRFKKLERWADDEYIF